MNTIFLEKDQVPAAWRGLLGYKGRKFKVEQCESYTINAGDAQWDGGTLYRYIALYVGPSGFNAKPLSAGNHTTGPIVGTDHVRMIVSHCTFRGKDMGLTFHVHPDNAARFMPAQDELSDDERIVCEVTASLKSHARLEEAERTYGMNRERWEAAKATCIEKGLLRSNGAITPKGRNHRIKSY